MHRVLLLVFVASLFAVLPASAQNSSAPTASTPPSSPAPTARRKRIAIFDFDYATVQTASQAYFGSNVDIGKGISDLLVRDLVKDGTYSVIERKAMDKILAEQNFSNSDRADANSAAKIGKILGVDAIIVGSVTQFGNDNKHTGIGGAGGGIPGMGGLHIGKNKSKAVVVLDARIVNIDTAEIMGVATGKGEAERDSTSVGGGGSNWHSFGGGDVDFGASDFQQTIIGEAINAAVLQMTSDLVADNPKLSARTINVEGLVAAVDGGQIVLNIGAKAGLKVGDQLTVKRITKEIKDPNTGQVIRKLTSDVGVIRLTDVDDISAVGAPVTGSGFKVGDQVKTITQ
jgi:curli biogenesis system outer membrane secretion channel CsgG